MRLLLTTVSLLLWIPTVGQNSDSAEIVKLGWVFEKTAIPAQGFDNYFKWINENNRLKILPNTPSNINKVFIELSIDKTGQVHEVKIAKGMGYPYDQEAIRLIKENPNIWQPAEHRGKKLDSTLVLPVQFFLTEENNREYR
jgi:hypothetical protein